MNAPLRTPLLTMPFASRAWPWLVATVTSAFALAGCSIPIPQAEADPTRYYVLSPTMAPATSATASDAGAVVQLGPIEIASYLRARPLIVRKGENEIEYREFARWGEPLEVGIGRVLREELLARGAAKSISSAAARAATGAPDFAVTVRVLACEGGPNGRLNFRAVWEVASVGEKPALVGSGDYRPADLQWDGKSEASMAAGVSRAIAGLAAEIASTLKK